MWMGRAKLLEKGRHSAADTISDHVRFIPLVV